MITRQYDLSVSIPALSLIGIPERDCVFFDIETTGFKAGFSRVYLIGAALRTSRGWRIMQWMSEGDAEETVLLMTFASFVRPFSSLIHFNGTRFDLPFLQERYAACSLPCPLENMRSVDIYQDIRPFRALLGLEHMNQKALESFLDCHREDRFDGGELIRVYRDFCKTNDPVSRQNGLDLLLLHNKEDVQGMLTLTGLYACRQLLQAEPAAAGNGSGTFGMTSHVGLPFPFRLQRDFEWGSLLLSGSEASFRIAVTKGQMYHFFDNYQEYYYLPDEDEAIHKSVAAFVDRHYRKKATARTCYIKKTGSFLPVFDDVGLPLFRSAYEDHRNLIMLPEDPSDPAFLRPYWCQCIRQAISGG
ncbi:MAG: ribonuclease H-like domain-containing protein [Lachnospiraceae bacterium]|nr:ribonuclease H-like domain-containing protein [Lachnospiraceae bacterium]